MKELKSKKTGKISILSEEEYSTIVNKMPEWLKRFEITDIKSMRPIIAAELKNVIKTNKTKI